MGAEVLEIDKVFAHGGFAGRYVAFFLLHCCQSINRTLINPAECFDRSSTRIVHRRHGRVLTKFLASGMAKAGCTKVNRVG